MRRGARARRAHERGVGRRAALRRAGPAARRASRAARARPAGGLGAVASLARAPSAGARGAGRGRPAQLRRAPP
ncbi:MAG: hypothetical protein EVA89_37770 [Sandaracinaceae bacterium]|nr:MAG: hypothetical protein EVA89_37770 [Sandaracinaceae bacterium]